MLGRRRRRRANNKTTLGQCLVFAGSTTDTYSYTDAQDTQHIHPMLVQCWTTVYNAGPTLDQQLDICAGYLLQSHELHSVSDRICLVLFMQRYLL